MTATGSEDANHDPTSETSTSGGSSENVVVPAVVVPNAERVNDSGRNNGNDNSNGGTNATRTHSALHTRLLNQQRSNILLQVLFHHMLNSRRRREEEEALALTPPPLPDREMPILSHEEALAINAMCRFCFEGSVVVDENNKENDGSNIGTTATTTMEDNSEGNLSSSNNSTSGSAGATPNALVAPCNCAGGSKWVHLECLRQWQRLQARNLSSSNLTAGGEATTYTAAGYICNVCNSPYLSRPPAVRQVRRNLLKRGTLLVSKPNVGRTFQQTVVLLLSDVCGNPQGAFGLIVNSPLQEELTPNHLLLRNNSTTTSSQNNSNSSSNSEAVVPNNGTDGNENLQTNNVEIEWRRGGPVCGGRLGVVHYTVLHTYPPPPALGGGHPQDVLDVDIDEEYIDDQDDPEVTIDTDDSVIVDDGDVSLTDDEDDDIISDQENDNPNEIAEFSDDDDDDEACVPLSLPVFDLARNTPPLQFVASPDSSVPSTFSEDNLGHTVQRLVGSGSNADTNNTAATTEQAEASSSNNNEEAASRTDVQDPQKKVIVFSGYCKWRAGQLEREIQREVWDVCIDATPEDILRHGNGFWEEMTESSRLLSWQRLIEEGETTTPHE